ncbi:hypothetical protein AC579_7954 [Pseudocercospora musae]|uniref:Uncharacterized protein n=1 Tax=Pseudocercospora musae TaxID=113226 RepID=A0A139I8E7_9PEZI|nr:hypothetical protein AC579_7954 [Pseudocercospora musae]
MRCMVRQGIKSGRCSRIQVGGGGNAWHGNPDRTPPTATPPALYLLHFSRKFPTSSPHSLLKLVTRHSAPICTSRQSVGAMLSFSALTSLFQDSMHYYTATSYGTIGLIASFRPLGAQSSSSGVTRVSGGHKAGCNTNHYKLSSFCFSSY